MGKYIHHSKPMITAQDIESVVNTIKSGLISQGNLNKKFEEKFNEYIGSQKCKLTNSGRSALFLALKILDIKNGDEVIIPSYVCSSVLKTIENIGAIPIIIDINDNYCICKNIIETSITSKTKAIILVHTFGISANIKPINKFLKEKNVYLIEDCAHAVGGEYHNAKLGSFGDMSFFSFQATKMLTSGEGGAIILNNKKFLKKFEDVVLSYGKLFAISDINVSLLYSQFNELDNFILKRKQLASIYIEQLKDIENITVPITNINESIFFRFIIKIKDLDFEKIRKFMHQNNIAVRKGVDSMLYQKNEIKYYNNSETIFNETLSLPIYPELKINDVLKIASIIKEAVNEL